MSIKIKFIFKVMKKIEIFIKQLMRKESTRIETFYT
jgi:hypothetical protein